MSVIAKFTCATKHQTTMKIKNEAGQIVDMEGPVSLTFYPVFSGSEENKKFWSSTPSGSISMYITNPEAYDQFKAGHSYYVTFEEAEV